MTEQPRTEAGQSFVREWSLSFSDEAIANLSDRILAIEAEAAPSRDALAEALAQHWVTAMECDHDAKTDTVRCSCSVWTGTPQPSVGAAVREWVAHVLAALPAPAAAPLKKHRHQWGYSMTEQVEVEVFQPSPVGAFCIVCKKLRHKPDTWKRLRLTTPEPAPSQEETK